VDAPQSGSVGQLESVDSGYAARGVILVLEGHINPHGLVLRVGLADDHLDDLAVLAEEFLAAKTLDELVSSCLGLETRDVDQVSLSDAQAGEMLPAEMVGLALLGLLLLGGGLLLGLLGDVLSVLRQPRESEKP
jgi:hypothetical protein